MIAALSDSEGASPLKRTEEPASLNVDARDIAAHDRAGQYCIDRGPGLLRLP